MVRLQALVLVALAAALAVSASPAAAAPEPAGLPTTRDPTARAPGTKLVRYFRVEVTSTGVISSEYVGNEQAVQYRGTQDFSWNLLSREIYEYREFTTGDAPVLMRACYGRKQSTCSPTKRKAVLKEQVDLVEDPREDATAITCDSRRTSPKPKGSSLPSWTEIKRSHRSHPVLGHGGSFGGSGSGSPFYTDEIRPTLEADFTHHIPSAFKDDECWHGIGHHWISALELPDDPGRLGCLPDEAWSPPLPALGGAKELLWTPELVAGWAGANNGAFDQIFVPPKPQKFRKARSAFTVTNTCRVSLPIEHETYASHEHTTAWSSTWAARFIPLKESQLERAIKGLRKLR